MTTHESCDEDGYFLLIVEPKQDVDEEAIIRKYFTFVLDVSGSMDGHKLDQAKAAAHYFIEHLNNDDRFNVVTFNDRIGRLFNQPERVNDGARQRALSQIRELWASGGTNINDGLLTALDANFDPAFARIVVLLTDGRPTAGPTEPASITTNVQRANASASRIFTFGIGADVNQRLLESLAAANRGQAQMLSASNDISSALSWFFERINRPVLTDVQMSFGDVPVYHTHPELRAGDATDLFAGTQLFIVGRYRTGGWSHARLSGSLHGRDRIYDLPLELPACALDENPFLPRLWAKARIDALIAQMAASGVDDPEIIQEIEDLSMRYGVQSRYTRFGVSDAGDPNGAQPSSGAHSPRDPAPYSADPGSSRGGYSSGALDQEDGCQAAPGSAVGQSWAAIALLVLAIVVLRTRSMRNRTGAGA